MPDYRHNQRTFQSGVSLISATIALLLISIAVLAYLQVVKTNHDKVVAAQNELIATRYASELLELFSSFSNAQLNSYLFLNPGKFTLGPVPLCAHINVLNRASNQMFNVDSVADLSASSRLPNGAGNLRPNRYYQVRVIDAETLNFDSAACGSVVPYNFGANPSKRFLVTVSVTWVPAGAAVADVRRAEVSTILPEL